MAAARPLSGNQKSQNPAEPEDTNLKQKLPRMVRPRPHPLLTKLWPPAARPFGSSSPNAHEQGRLPWFLPRLNFLIPFFGSGLLTAERALAQLGELNKVASRFYPSPPARPCFRGSGRKWKGPSSLSLNIYLIFYPFTSPERNTGKQGRQLGDLSCCVLSATGIGHGAAPGVRLQYLR